MKTLSKILIIDPFIKQPVNNCFNRLTDLFNSKLYLYQPAFFPFDLYTIPKVDAYIMLGSASHVHEKLSWHQQLSHFLDLELKSNKPVLGLCFGHQLMSDYYGAKVEFIYSNQEKIVGSRSINWENKSYQLGVTHRQAVIELSSNLLPLSPKSSAGFDMVKHATLPFWGCQAHPEASENFLIHDCQIQDFQQRQKILDDSASFLKSWMQAIQL